MEILIEILFILSLNFIFLWIFSFLRIPPIISLVISGFILGPSGFGIIQNYQNIEILSEIGIILLLFTIGLEFSLKELEKQKKNVFILGSLQIFFTILISALIFKIYYNYTISFFIGMILSLSSTAIVLKILQDENQIQSPYGKIAISVLIFQDLVAILYVILLPYLKNFNQNNKGFFDVNLMIQFLTKIILIILLFYLLYKFIVPYLLYQIVKTRNKDLFVLTIITFCFLIAFGTYKAGLSLAFGAFLAGLLISETHFSYESISNIIPFKIIFTSIFFTSIGMMVDLHFFISNWTYILLLSLFIIIIKFFIIFFLILIFNFNLRISFITGLYLAQAGEFSLIVLKIGLNYQIIDSTLYQTLLISSILTMLYTPFIMNYSHPVFYKMMEMLSLIAKKLPFKVLKKLIRFSQFKKDDFILHQINDHIIIIGYGINGRNVAKAAKIVDIPYLIIEMNIKTVQNEQKKGEPIIFGDATNIHLLEHIGIKKAKLLVIVINDFRTTKQIIKIAKKLNPNIYTIARTRYIAEVPLLLKEGANDVIPEEFETSIQIFRKILEHYNFSFPEIQFFIEELRISGYEILRREL